MYEEITFQRLSAGSVFKLVAIGISVTMVPFCLLMGVMALLGSDTVTWNNAHIHGFSALVASPLIGAIISVIFTLFFGSFMAFGLWIFSKFRPMTLVVKQTLARQNG